MKQPSFSGILRRVKKWMGRDPDRFLRRVDGAIHIGAHMGQERYIYDEYGLDMIWIEANPKLYAMLVENLKELPKQQAFNCLITDQEGKEYTFNVASNDGASSSIFELKDHKEIWPDVSYESQLKLKSTTLERLFSEEGIDASRYQALIMDVQGAELLVLKGVGSLLDNFRYIKAEAADFELYAGCCTVDDLGDFLAERGFRERERQAFAQGDGAGTCYDVIYERV